MESARKGTESQDIERDLPPTVQKADPELKNKDEKKDATKNHLTSGVHTKKIGSEYWLG